MDKKGTKTPPRAAGIISPVPVPSPAVPVTPAPANSKLYANLPLTPPSTKLMTDPAMNTIKKIVGVGKIMRLFLLTRHIWCTFYSKL